MGASCVYPLLGARMYGWSFVGTEVNQMSFDVAKTNVNTNIGMLNQLYSVPPTSLPSAPPLTHTYAHAVTHHPLGTASVALPLAACFA